MKNNSPFPEVLTNKELLPFIAVEACSPPKINAERMHNMSAAIRKHAKHILQREIERQVQDALKKQFRMLRYQSYPNKFYFDLCPLYKYIEDLDQNELTIGKEQLQIWLDHFLIVDYLRSLGFQVPNKVHKGYGQNYIEARF